MENHDASMMEPRETELIPGQSLILNPSEPIAQREPIYSEHIYELALILFDCTQVLHALSDEDRITLERVVRLCQLEARPRYTKRKLFLAALEFVKAQLNHDLNEKQQNILAAMVAFQHGKLKRKKLKRQGLCAEEQRVALTLVALLQIAEGLDASGSGDTTIQKIEPSENGMWIIVEGPSAAMDAAEATRRAHLWEQIGYPEVEIIEAAVAAGRLTPYPEPKGNIGVLPGDSLAEAGRKVMRFHFAQMLRHEQGTRLGEDIEALHDMRVATRRLRAAFEVFGGAFDPGILKLHLRGLRATGRVLGGVRDLDVFMDKAHRYIDALPEEKRGGLDPLLARWKEQRDAARLRMLEHLTSWEYAEFKRKFNIFLNTPESKPSPQPTDQPMPDQVCQLAPVLIYTRMASTRAYETLLAEAPIERLHALRIEFKKLRYTVEYFAEVLGKRSREIIEDLKLLQDHLGDLNDAQIATQILGEFIEVWDTLQASLPIQERQNIEEVVSYLAARHAERHHLLVTFQAAWEMHFYNRSFRRNLAQAISAL